LLANIRYFGEGFLAAIFLLCGFAAVFGLTALKLEIETARKVFYWARRAMFAAVGLSAIVLILLTAAFLTNDFSIAAVSQYSSKELPFFYKLSAVWAGSAGSLLLWSVGVFGLFGLWLAETKINDFRFDTTALSIGSAACLGFSALLVFVSKPFATCPVTLDDGVSLNPLLQNFWMITHPPLLFIGYSAFLIPFVIVLASVFTGRTDCTGLYRQLRRWLLFGICFLGLGIATGAKWSYVELGWGGYWAWDPVENASLLPWLVAVAALHSLVGTRITSKFRLWTVALVPLPFILCLVATFITRSAVLQSVHAFSQNVMFSALLAFISCCFLLWIVCIARAVRAVPAVSPSRTSALSLSKSDLLFWTNVILVSTAVVIGIATFWPIVSRFVARSSSGITPTRLFYDRIISVVGIVLAFLVGLAGLADFQKRNGFILRVLSCCGMGLVCFGLVFWLGREQLLINLAFGICAFSFVAVSMKLWLSLKGFGKVGGNISHLGLLLLVVAVGFSSSEQVVQARLAKEEKITLGSYDITYHSFKHKLVDGVTKVGPEIIIRKKGLEKKLWPHNNLYPTGHSSAEVAVHTGILEDIYISFDSVGWDGRVAIEAKLKPLMLWLWLAALLIVAGLALAILEGKRKRV